MSARSISAPVRLAISALRLYTKKGGGARFAVECNFTPGCSEYARIALQRFGVRRGVPMIVSRLRRCNDPNCMHPVPDPVPDPGPEQSPGRAG